MMMMIRKNVGWLATIGLFAAWFFVFGPANLGGPATYVVVDGTSMQPTFVNGDLAVARRSDTYRPGEVIAFHIPGNGASSRGLVIHRIVGGTADDGFVTQGDNRDTPDPWRPRTADIAGSVRFAVPGIGAYMMSLRSPLVLAPMAAALTVFVVMLSNAFGGRRSNVPGTSRVAVSLRRAQRARRFILRAVAAYGRTAAIVAATCSVVGFAAGVRL